MRFDLELLVRRAELDSMYDILVNRSNSSRCVA